jgi:hypothetical protein
MGIILSCKDVWSFVFHNTKQISKYEFVFLRKRKGKEGKVWRFKTVTKASSKT